MTTALMSRSGVDTDGSTPVGVNLRDLFPQHPVPEGWFDGKRIAVDGHNVAFRYLSSFRGREGDILRRRDHVGHVSGCASCGPDAERAIGHLIGFVNLVRHLRERGAEPIVVWDGTVHGLKRRTVDERIEGRRKASDTRQNLVAEQERGNRLGAKEYGRVLRAELEADIGLLESLLPSDPAVRDELEDKRRELARAAFLPDDQYGALRLVRLEDDVVVARRRVTQLDGRMIDDCTRLLSSIGVAVVQAPHDGERYAAALCLAGHAQAVATEDFDALVAGAPLVLRKVGGLDCRLHRLSDLEGHQITRDQLRHIAILSGTDFHPGVKGFGAKTAAKMLKQTADLRGLISEAQRGEGVTRYHKLLREDGLTLQAFDEVDTFLAEVPATAPPAQPRGDIAVAMTLAAEMGLDPKRVKACFC